MKTVTVTAQRWDEGWELYVGDVGVTRSTTLATARQEAQAYLATMLGGEPEDYPISLFYRLGGLKNDAVASGNCRGSQGAGRCGRSSQASGP